MTAIAANATKKQIAKPRRARFNPKAPRLTLRALKRVKSSEVGSAFRDGRVSHDRVKLSA